MLNTPSVLVDEGVLMNNIRKYQNMCDTHGKKLFPMLKTHKSLAVAKLQLAAGAGGFLCGTLDECEALVGIGVENIMYAYPVATEPAISRVLRLSRLCNFFIRIDGVENGAILSEAAEKSGDCVNYTIIVNCGLNRFGVAADKARELADRLKPMKGLRFAGISTHPGHVYAADGADDVPRFASDEKNAIKTAACALAEAGYQLDFISSGSTPTFKESVADERINIFHPGNYVFNDVTQVNLGAATLEDCALSVLASVVSNPSKGLYIIDAGSKTLGLDKGAHGSDAITGYGLIKGRPEFMVASLSEEVGKIVFSKENVSLEASLRVGDKIEIIPNHACVPANLTSYLIRCTGDDVIGVFDVDIRGNSKPVRGF